MPNPGDITAPQPQAAAATRGGGGLWASSPLLRGLSRAWQHGGRCIASWLRPSTVVELHPQAVGPARLYDATGRACPGLAPRSWRLWGIRRWHADPVADDLLLRRTWWQPGTDDDAHRAAVVLRGRLESPFPPDDTLFLWADQPPRVRIDVARIEL